MDLKQRIKFYLSNGVQAKEVATICGCSVKYVAELLQNPDFKKEVEEEMTGPSERTEEERLDTKIEGLQHALVAGIMQDIPEASFIEKVKALDVVSKVRMDQAVKKDPAKFAPKNITVVNLELPAQHAKQLVIDAEEVKVNSKNEIIAIGDRNLVSMPSKGVENMFERIQAARKEKKAVELELFSDPLPISNATSS